MPSVWLQTGGGVRGSNDDDELSFDEDDEVEPPDEYGHDDIADITDEMFSEEKSDDEESGTENAELSNEDDCASLDMSEDNAEEIGEEGSDCDELELERIGSAYDVVAPPEPMATATNKPAARMGRGVRCFMGEMV